MCLIESIILRQEKVTLPDVIYFGQKSAKNTHLFLHQPLKTAAKAKGNVLRRGFSKAKACRVKGGGGGFCADALRHKQNRQKAESCLSLSLALLVLCRLLQPRDNPFLTVTAGKKGHRIAATPVTTL